ncbi:hypothetical protein I7I48_03483 [Histoplasma ohiense]|nr:hypothetical protein I7I48_03483 [Histoplasma ohiense (nom. inval.)]
MFSCFCRRVLSVFISSSLSNFAVGFSSFPFLHFPFSSLKPCSMLTGYITSTFPVFICICNPPLSYLFSIYFPFPEPNLKLQGRYSFSLQERIYRDILLYIWTRHPPLIHRIPSFSPLDTRHLT